MAPRSPRSPKASSLSLIAKPDAFFHELLTKALGHHQLAPQPETEFYLVNLLSEFMTTDRLYSRDEKGKHKEEPLALLFKQALEAREPREQGLLYRHVGDVSLYVAGFFRDSLSRKHVDIDYYIGMGESAYQHASVLTEAEVRRQVFSELAQRFSSFVEVLSDVSVSTAPQPRSESDLLKLYDTWLRTKSDRAAKALKKAGILPNTSIKKDVQ